MNQFTQPLVTQEERRAYGDDLLDVVSRKALETMTPHLNRLQNENQDLRARLQANEARSIYEILDEAIPKWKALNVDADFLSWLQGNDIYSGGQKAVLLRQAFQQGDANRVLSFFRGYLIEHPNSQYQPGSSGSRSARQSSSRSSADAAGEWTTKMIESFYERVRQGAFNGKEEEKNRIEANLIAAVNEGRVRRT
jgi:hypothetical protein